MRHRQQIKKRHSLNKVSRFQYSDFDIGLHRSVKDCALGVLKRQEGQLNEEVVRTITTKIKEVSNYLAAHFPSAGVVGSDDECVRMAMHFRQNVLNLRGV
ncbi:unnamed protein product [Nippostrongylus brasiliensis]|uniref:Phosphagen kinase C-terminal domain-containing protein n=1 Tax=Nippostrongylus brasiliensis TaxID=27835 RepID=A0A0N4Y9P1_NIPBR|nr:unnamed protein product [Nippostrongylus brasiliensis]